MEPSNNFRPESITTIFHLILAELSSSAGDLKKTVNLFFTFDLSQDRAFLFRKCFLQIEKRGGGSNSKFDNEKSLQMISIY